MEKQKNQNKTYNSVQAAKILRCSDRMVGRYIHEGKLRAVKGGRDWIIEKRELDRFIIAHGKQKQLCETCGRACGGCKWSDELLPVDGWSAEPSKIYINKRKPIDSFYVKSCPEYRPDGPKNIGHLTNDAAYRLMYAILFAMVHDYADSCRKLYVEQKPDALAYQKLKEIKQYVNTPMFDEMLGVLQFNTDGPTLLEMIRADPLGVLQRIGHIDEYTNRKEKEYNDYQGDK